VLFRSDDGSVIAIGQERLDTSHGKVATVAVGKDRHANWYRHAPIILLDGKFSSLKKGTPANCRGSLGDGVVSIAIHAPA